MWRILWPAVMALSVTLVPPAPAYGTARTARPALTWQSVAVRRISAPCLLTPAGCIRRIEVTTVVFAVRRSGDQRVLGGRGRP
ncbi:hypothetical protein [Amycolatopsis sp. NBC_00438]|uniref:hypothetical protein n=1 Tax=Amycolatopsis sp. NBC_00438 TaxID=2903558 RepID=UPI002E1B9DEE